MEPYHPEGLVESGPELRRRETAIEDPLYRAIFEKAEPFLCTRNNGIHTIISYEYAVRLLSSEGGHPSVAIPSILLHDVGWSTVPEEEQLLAFGPVVRRPDLLRRHEIQGARIAEDILRELKYPDDLISKIALIIDGHDSRAEATDIDDMIVKDSDKLFRYSQVGFGIYCRLFNHKPQKYLGWLSRIAEKWFFTKTALAVAREEVERRLEDLQR